MLKEVSLDSNPTFQAISYTWGEAIFPCDLICDSHTINVTQNLHDALSHFRDSGQELTIWIDAICINQFNEDEKSQQIPLMAEIYRKASNVLIWLGVESDGSAEAMQYLARIGKKFLDRGGPVREPKIEQNDEHGAENKVLWDDVLQDKTMRKTEMIWTRPWFSRRWVIQEIAFAQSAIVHCGMEQVEWDILAKAAEVLTILDGDGSQFMNRRSGKLAGPVCLPLHNAIKLERIRKELWASDAERTERQLYDCLDDARGFDCRYDKDRIFALLGIINHRRKNPFTIAYAKPTAEVFAGFARYCLREGESLGMLCWAGVSNHAFCGESLQLPSWVPDWRLPFRNPSDKLQGFDSGIRIDVGDGLDDSTAEFSTIGKLIDRVVAICPCVGFVEEMAMAQGSKKWTVVEPGYVAVWYQALEALLIATFQLINVDVSSEEYVAGGESIWEALGRTLVLDLNTVSFDMKPHIDSLVQKENVPEGSPPPKLTDEFFKFRNFVFLKYGKLPSPVRVRDAAGRPIDAITRPRDSTAQPRDATTEGNMNFVIDYEWMEYVTRLVDRCQNRSFFVTGRGYIGLGPKEMQRGDLICVLDGLRAPCVLRPQNNDFMMCGESPSPEGDVIQIELDGRIAEYVDRTCKEKFQLIGECYTHGLMSNEAWTNYDFLIEEFTII
jgi:hypothetical protein